MAKKPVERSREMLRKRGFSASIVERWNTFDRSYEPAFGFISVIAMRPGEPGLLGIHITPADPAVVAKKLLDEQHAKNWLQAGNRIEIHGWYKESDPEVNPRYWKWVVRTELVTC